MSANERIAFRYSFTPANTALRRCLSENPSSRPRDLHAGGETLHVPLPGPDRGLIEVVDVEDQVTLRRAEHPEVRQVRVAAELGPQPGGRRGRRGPLP